MTATETVDLYKVLEHDQAGHLLVAFESEDITEARRWMDNRRWAILKRDGYCWKPTTPGYALYLVFDSDHGRTWLASYTRPFLPAVAA